MDYAEQLLDDMGALACLPENLRYYFSVEDFAKDLELNGDVDAFTFNGESWVAEQR